MKSTIIYPLKMIAVISFLTLIDCTGTVDCHDLVAYYRPHKCAIIVQKIIPERPFRLKGINAYSGKEDRYNDGGGGWNNLYQKQLEIGDTVIKRENELTFYIYKKDTVLRFPFECEGKTYH